MAPRIWALVSDHAGDNPATHIRLADGMPRFQVRIEDAGERFPSGDSISMVSESVITEKNRSGSPHWSKVSLGGFPLGPDTRIARNRVRDLRRFWTYLHRHRLAGTVAEPVATTIDNPELKAAFDVLELIQGRD